MAAVRHILRTNTWEMECPECHRMVPINRDIFTGKLPFKSHSPWRASWSQKLFDKYGMARAIRDTAWKQVRYLIYLEGVIRSFTERWEPTCSYNETVAWNKEQWPASGIDSYGPTA